MKTHSLTGINQSTLNSSIIVLLIQNYKMLSIYELTHTQIQGAYITTKLNVLQETFA